MATKKTKTLAAVATVTDVTARQFIPLTDENGNLTKVSLASLKASLLAGIDLDSINDGVFIIFHRKSDGFSLMVKPHRWASYQSAGEIAEGVAVVEGGKVLVVAPTEAKLYWSSAAVSAGGKTTTIRLTALNDWTGQMSTAAQASRPECSGENYAPGFCARYSRTNANGKGLTAGTWWLPSLGELMLIYANARKINYALSLIEGATPLTDEWYWSSTEHASNNVWSLYFGNTYGGGIGINVKATYKGRVRPVTVF